MTKSLLNFARIPAVLLLGLSLAGAPALADKGGNGGHGGGSDHGGGGSDHGNKGGNSGSHRQDGASEHGRSSHHATTGNAADDSTDTADGADDSDAPAKVKVKSQSASSLGKLNGFLHASPKAIANAAPNSAIGKVVSGYGGLLSSYLSTDTTSTTTKPTAAELAAALQAASNKPVTADTVAAVNAKLLSVDAGLAADLTTSGMTLDDLNAEIAAAL